VQPVSNRVQIRPLQLNFVAPGITQRDGGSNDHGPAQQER